MADIEMNYYNGSSYEKIYPLGCCKIRTVTLASGSWGSSGTSQTVSVPGVIANKTAQKITVAPAQSSRDTYQSCGVQCVQQNSGNLMFTADSKPSVNLTVYVTLEEVTTAT